MIRALLIANFLMLAGPGSHLFSAAQTETTSVSNTASSNFDFQTTASRLEAAITARGLTLFNEIDHAAGAASVDLALAPNRLYIFGNPKAGTPLMLANPALGLELPLKANVREEDGHTLVTVSDIRAITAAAGVTEPAAVINKIEETLQAILSDATTG